MRSLELLITAVRRETDNSEFDSSTGLQDEEFIQYANDAQDEILSQIHMQSPKALLGETVISLTAGVEQVDIPADVFLNERVVQVEYSQSGGTNFYPLRKGNLSERVNGFSGEPAFYIRRNGKILLEPPPQSSGGQLKLTYQLALPGLDIRLGKVDSVTLTSNAITSLMLDTGFEIKADELAEEGYFTVVGFDGEVKMRDILIDSVDETTGTVTIGSGFTFDSGETIAAGDYVCRGKYRTSISRLPDICERYILAFMAWKVLKRDSSEDAMGKLQELTVIGQTIVDSFKIPDDDVDYIPILDSQFLNSD